MASATFSKPKMFAPTTKLPGLPYFSAVASILWKIPTMIDFSFASTSSNDQKSRWLDCALSSALVATPPAFAA